MTEPPPTEPFAHVGSRTAAAVLPRACLSPLVMLVPSRGRPTGLAATIAAHQANAAGMSALVAVVDEDDPELEGYLALSWPLTIVGPRLRLGGTLNRYAPACAALGAFAVGFMGDDHRPRSRGYDAALVSALRTMGSGVAYGDDLFQHERIPTAVAITGDILTTLDAMVPPGMTHLYLDDWWRLLGEEIGRLAYLPEVVIEHMHPDAGKAPRDARYDEVNSGAMWQADGQALGAYLHGADWARDRDRLHALLDGEPWNA